MLALGLIKFKEGHQTELHERQSHYRNNQSYLHTHDEYWPSVKQHLLIGIGDRPTTNDLPVAAGK
jgi:hypothetical protein